jgi:hypothetical protein
MTMIAHSLKNIIELIPQALEHVKQASVDQEMPLDSKASTIATALELQYFEKIAHKSVNVFALEKVAQAVELYGVTELVKELGTALVKAAADCKVDELLNTNENFFLKVAAFEGTHANMSIEERSATATALYKEAKQRNIDADELVMLYSGNGYLSKEAAVKALAVRYHTTQNTDFVKLAGTIGRMPDTSLSPELLIEISDTICKLDKMAGLNFQGHNFYKEAFFLKESAFKSSMSVRLCGKDIPYESIERVGRQKVASYIGEDIAKEMDAGPQNFKAVVETLPLDLQNVLHSLVKNV